MVDQIFDRVEEVFFFGLLVCKVGCYWCSLRGFGVDGSLCFLVF